MARQPAFKTFSVQSQRADSTESITSVPLIVQVVPAQTVGALACPSRYTRGFTRGIVEDGLAFESTVLS